MRQRIGETTDRRSRRPARAARLAAGESTDATRHSHPHDADGDRL